MSEGLKAVKEYIYEVYTCSGNRIAIKGVVDTLVDYQIGTVAFMDKEGIYVGNFMLDNIEGWRVAP